MYAINQDIFAWIAHSSHTTFKEICCFLICDIFSAIPGLPEYLEAASDEQRDKQPACLL